VRRVTEVFFSSVEDKKEELINILKTTLESNLEKENHIEK
jgi:hypothetical protein